MNITTTIATCHLCEKPFGLGCSPRVVPGCEHIVHEKCLDIIAGQAQANCPKCHKVFQVTQLSSDQTLLWAIDQIAQLKFQMSRVALSGEPSKGILVDSPIIKKLEAVIENACITESRVSTLKTWKAIADLSRSQDAITSHVIFLLQFSFTPVGAGESRPDYIYLAEKNERNFIKFEEDSAESFKIVNLNPHTVEVRILLLNEPNKIEEVHRKYLNRELTGFPGHLHWTFPSARTYSIIGEQPRVLPKSMPHALFIFQWKDKDPTIHKWFAVERTP